MRTKLGMDKRDKDSDSRIIVVEVEDQTIGFIVDMVSEVLRVPKDVFEAPPEMVSGIDSEYIKEIGKLEDRLLILLDLNKILSLDEMVQLEDVTEK